MAKTQKRTSRVSGRRTKKNQRSRNHPRKIWNNFASIHFFDQNTPSTTYAANQQTDGRTDGLTDRHLLFFQGDFSNVRTQLLTQLGMKFSKPIVFVNRAELSLPPRHWHFPYLHHHFSRGECYLLRDMPQAFFRLYCSGIARCTWSIIHLCQQSLSIAGGKVKSDQFWSTESPINTTWGQPPLRVLS